MSVYRNKGGYGEPMTIGSEVDVLIVGAGISGIEAAVHLHQRCPEKSFLMLEKRARVGDTWGLFRYPGARSDSEGGLETR